MICFLILPALISMACASADPSEELLNAARMGNLIAVKQLIEKGATIEAKTAYGQTPLFLAAMNGREDVVGYLLDKGANADASDSFYKMPLLVFVIQREHYSVAKLLLQKGTKNPDMVLSQIVPAGKADLVKTLLDNNKVSREALNTAYENALIGKQADLAAILKKAGAEEPSPLMKIDLKVLESYAGEYKSSEIEIPIRAFIKDGTLFMQPTGQGEIPLKPKSQTVFEFKQAQIVVEFDSTSGFILKQGNMSYPFKKAVSQ
jgi:hypothetical protein